MSYPINMPKLPLHEEPDGTYLNLHQDRFGRWIVDIVSEDGFIIDQMQGFEDVIDALTSVAREYPRASYTPED